MEGLQQLPQILPPDAGEPVAGIKPFLNLKFSAGWAKRTQPIGTGREVKRPRQRCAGNSIFPYESPLSPEVMPCLNFSSPAGFDQSD